MTTDDRDIPRLVVTGSAEQAGRVLSLSQSELLIGNFVLRHSDADSPSRVKDVVVVIGKIADRQ